MHVFSSLRASDINPTAVATQGPALLADFLRFAETGKMMTSSGSTAADAESPFELEVGEALEAMGYLVDRQVGVGAYRIDIGVRGRDRPGIYVAGVECDGAAYHAAPCARDRDRLRQQVLEQRGWTILRVWSTDWYRDHARAQDRLRRSLEDLAESGGSTHGSSSGTVPESAASPPEEQASAVAVPEPGPDAPDIPRLSLPPYRTATPSRAFRGSLLDANSHQVGQEAARIVAVEGPIHQDEVVARLLEFWGHERRGGRLVRLATGGVEAAIRSGAAVRRDGFLYAAGASTSPRCRTGLSHGPDLVAFEELAEAARRVVEHLGAVKEEDLASEVSRALGLRRSRDGMPRIRQAIQSLVDKGVLVFGVSGLRLRKES